MSPQTLDKPAIECLIPHKGSMCLLDKVEQWDQQTVACISMSHHLPHNPLLEDGQLNAMVLVEYAAQAAAIHASLTGAGIGGTHTALIGAVKALKLHCRSVAPSQKILTVVAQSILQSGGGAIYQIEVRAQDALLVEARVVLVLPKTPD